MFSKKFTILLAAVVLCSAIYACTSSTKVFEDNPPFHIKEASFQNWFAGAQEFGRGIHFFLEMEKITEYVQIDSVYFRGMAGILQRDPNNILKYKANLKADAQRDMVMDENPVKEMNNPVPNIDKDFPYDLNSNEAVLSYRKNNKRYYYKLTDLKEIESLNYPSSKRGENNN